MLILFKVVITIIMCRRGQRREKEREREGEERDRRPRELEGGKRRVR